MKLILSNRLTYILGACTAIVVIVGLTASLLRQPNATLITATVTRGEVTELVSVSGVVEAENTAELAFPVTGIVREVLVTEGSVVSEGDILARLEQRSLLADRQDAQATLAAALADREELLNGPRPEQRVVTDTTIAIKENTLERIQREEALKVTSARRVLLSTGLEAVAVNANENAEPPTVSGTYECDEEGMYELSIYSSGAPSGYSFDFNGIERGIQSVTIDQPSPLGDCGLRLQFADGSFYNNSAWTISIPNTKGINYVTNLNAYELAVEQADKKIKDAEDALTLARKEQTLENADPRAESLARANAAIEQARAQVARVNAQIEDRTLRAPFGGTVTDVSILPGETVSTNPVITVLADDVFTLTARIPEIDITNVTVGQAAQIVFDARADEALTTEVDFVSPLATEIDGVAYYEARLRLYEPPAWLRSGLNADVEIIVHSVTDVMRLPTRFITTENDRAFVLLQQGDLVVNTPIEQGVIGNNGYIEVIGLTEGDTVVAP